MRRWFNWGPEPEPPRPPRRLTWPWRRLIRLPHLSLDNAKLASGLGFRRRHQSHGLGAGDADGSPLRVAWGRFYSRLGDGRWVGSD